MLLNFEGDLTETEQQFTVDTKINKRGVMDLVVQGGVKVVVPYSGKKGHAQVI